VKTTKQNLCKEISVKAPKPAVVLALAAEMARRLSENIAKVELKPLAATGSEQQNAASKNQP